MKHGIQITPDNRDDMARLAYAFAKAFPSDESAKAIATGFKVTPVVAVKLIERGAFLAAAAAMKVKVG
jgi:hypothetical protein